jgi:hypothetical protein
MRGSRPSKRWSGGRSTVTAARCSTPAAEEAGWVEGCQRKKKGGSGGLFGNFKNLRDLLVK